MMRFISGRINGTINGAEFAADCSGSFNTMGNRMNSFALTVQTPLPQNFNPIVVGMCWSSSFHGSAFLPAALGSKNLSEFIDGPIVSERTVKFLELPPSDGFHLRSEVIDQDGISTTRDARIEGNYSGPTDAIGVFDVVQKWTLNKNSNTVFIETDANILFQSGKSMPIRIETLYSGLSDISSLEVSKSVTIYGNQQWDGRVLSFDWVGIIVL